MHVVDRVAPPVSEYLFSKQGVHAPTPVAGLYVPAMHSVHTSPFAVAVCPAVQVQSIRASLPGSKNVFTGQISQVVDDVAARMVEYLLFTQLVHAPTPSVFFHVLLAHAVHGIPSLEAV